MELLSCVTKKYHRSLVLAISNIFHIKGMLESKLFTTDHLHMVATDHQYLLIKSDGDPFYNDHVGYIV